MLGRALSTLLVGLAIGLGMPSAEEVDAAPELQLPWPTGISHSISGNSYGCNTHNGSAQYYAIDFNHHLNEAVSAAAAGVVISATSDGDFGNRIIVDHGGGFTTFYAHLQSFSVAQWSSVSQGQTIGLAGATGYTEPPGAHHLHFVAQLNGVAYPPEPMSTAASGFGNYGFHGPPTCSFTASPSWTSLVPWVRNLAVNPSFENGNPASPWTPAEGATQMQAYPNGSPHSGSWYLQFNTSIQNGSIYQDIAETSSTGDSYIFTIWARAPGAFNCVQVNLALWALWGTNESAAKSYGVCGTSWQQLTTSIDVNDNSHTIIRAQIYSNTQGIDAGEQLNVDSADVIHVKNKNASFERGPGQLVPEWVKWQQFSTVTWARYDVSVSTPRSGAWHLQANKSNTSGASIFQDIPIVTTPGESYTFSIWLRRNGSGTRVARVVLWGIGGPSGNENTILTITNLSGSWVQYSVTRNMTLAGHTSLKAEIYLDSGPNLNYDFDGSKLVKN